MLAWRLWFHRNLFVWKQTDAPAVIVDQADRFLKEWQDAPAVFSRVQCVPWGRSSSRITWEKPADAIVRDHTGSFIRGCLGTAPTVWEVQMAELMAIRKTLSWLKTLNFGKVIFESDCGDVIDAYNSSRHDLSEFRLVLQDCLTPFGGLN
ncbi:hypothetical protein Gogos_005120 [Gossypium gossypioides]|uniref:RNase H type-1 domain-containing protein n=1 Tax=Gossypium gossypioides TaxID=34282 RepID=A0A7J9CII3_GOSGO|nr:hypothetical protein [Gossypium gossypioides]